MTIDRRVSMPPASNWSARVEFRRGARAIPSWPFALAVVSVALASAWFDATWAAAVYLLSFWHYFLYWLAYCYGAVEPREFRREAVFWKTIALFALGGAYLTAPLDLFSLSVVAAGFLLNALAARALGTERTYYGHELLDLPPNKITAFPYSWIAHPMLVGNVAAFGGTLLNADFRRAWWPLAVAHILMNLSLIVMELAVTPQRRNVRHKDSSDAVPSPQTLRIGDSVLVAAAALAAGCAAWSLSCPHPLVEATVAATMALYAVVLFRRYTATAPFERQEVQAQ